MRSSIRQTNDGGMALVAAIALLVIFAMLGTAYIGYMSIEFDQAKLQLHEIRARNLAEAGVYAAIGEARAAIARGEAPKPSMSVSLNEYRREAGGVGAYPQAVSVKLSDESARVNLNLAPAAVLRGLGLSESAAKAVVDYRANGTKRLASVDSLRTEGLLDGQTYRGLKADIFTVYTAADPKQARGYVNVNSAPAPVLSAIFGINADEAKALADKRPFATWADALQKIGREPSTFNVAAPASAPRDMPADLALASRCYRIQSVVELDMPGGKGKPTAGVDAVVEFLDNGAYTIRYWRETKGGTTKEMTAETPAPAAPQKKSEKSGD